MKLLSTLIALTLSCSLFGQYLEDFNVANRGIISGPCGTNDPTTCTSNDFTGVNWTITGDLSGIDSEGFFTSGGSLTTSDSDGRACWVSPTINIDPGMPSELSVSITTMGGWDDSGDLDYLDVEYSLDGGGFTVIPNVNGCPNIYTVSAIGCGADLTGTNNFTATATNLFASTIDVQVCAQLSLSSEMVMINSVSVPQGSLPVELVRFTADKMASGVALHWVTASEIDNEGFEVQHSTNGETWTALDFVEGQGTAYRQHQYDYTHSKPAAGSNYYRIKQMDFDGTTDYSPVKVIEWRGNNEISSVLNVTPNPATDELSISVPEAFEGNAVVPVRIFTQTGQLVYSENIATDQANALIRIQDLPQGFYVLEMQQNEQQFNARFIKQ